MVHEKITSTLVLLLLSIQHTNIINAAPYEDLVNNRPIIAILAQLAPPYRNVSYVAASYVKFLECSGARVVPVLPSMTKETVEMIFSSVNGVFFPGGSIKWLTSDYYHHASIFFNKAIEANKRGDYFPIWGTCLGLETLNVLRVGSESILESVSAMDISIPLNFTDAAPKSRLFQNIPQELYKKLATEPIPYHHHEKGIHPNTYIKEKSLGEFYDILSVNNGLNGTTFVTTMEAKDYPFYGTQWHPEKITFEFSTNEHITHSADAVRISHFMSQFFVNEARKSKHKFSSQALEKKYLIYNYKPTYSGRYGQKPLVDFDLVYYFP